MSEGDERVIEAFMRWVWATDDYAELLEHVLSVTRPDRVPASALALAELRDRRVQANADLSDALAAVGK